MVQTQRKKVDGLLRLSHFTPHQAQQLDRQPHRLTIFILAIERHVLLRIVDKCRSRERDKQSEKSESRE